LIENIIADIIRDRKYNGVIRELNNSPKCGVIQKANNSSGARYWDG